MTFPQLASDPEGEAESSFSLPCLIQEPRHSVRMITFSKPAVHKMKHASVKLSQ